MKQWELRNQIKSTKLKFIGDVRDKDHLNIIRVISGSDIVIHASNKNSTFRKRKIHQSV